MPDLLDGGEERVESRKQRHEGDTLPVRVQVLDRVASDGVVASDRELGGG